MKIILINPAYNRYGGVKGHGGSVILLNVKSFYGRKDNYLKVLV